MNVIVKFFVFAIVALCVVLVRAQVLPTQQHAALMTLYDAVGEE